MNKSEKLEWAVLKDSLIADEPDGRPTNLGQLYLAISRDVECRNAEIVAAMIRLRDDGHLRLLKWDFDLGRFVEYGDGTNEEEFFYRGDFRLLITPHGRRYFDDLQNIFAQEPPKRRIGFR